MKKNYKKNWRFFSALLIVITVFWCFTVFAQTTTKKETIRVGYTNKGMMINNHKGTFSGYGVDYLNLLSQYTDWNYDFVQVKESTRIEDLKNGRIDLLCDVSEDEVKADEILFSKSKSCIHYALLCMPEKDTSVFYNEFSAMNHKRIAINRSRKMEHMISEFARLHNITYTPVYCDDILQMEEAIQDGRADLMVASNQRELIGFKYVAKIGLREQFFAVSNENTQLIEELNRANKQLKLQKPFVIASLYETWYGRPVEVLSGVTREEYNFVNNQTPVRVVYDSNHFPISYRDPDSGKFKGIYEDALELVRQKTGLNMEFLPVDNHKEIWEMLKNGDADAAAGIYPDSTLKREYHVISAVSHLTNSYTLILRKDRSLSRPLTIALPEHAIELHSFVKNQYPDLTIVTGRDEKACLKMSNNGDADGTLIDSVLLQTVHNLSNYQNLAVIPMHSTELPISFAFGGEHAELLCQIFDRVIRTIPASSFENCITENSVSISYEPTFREMLWKFAPVFLSLFALLVILYMFSLWLKEKHFHHLAMTDFVTGLWNGFCFRQKAKELFAHNPYSNWQLISMDIECFRYINTDFGEKNADLLLQIIAKRLRSIYGEKKNAIYARAMGDIFLILSEPYYNLPEVIDTLTQKVVLNANGSLHNYVPDMKFGICNISSGDKHLSINEYIDCANYARKSIKGKVSTRLAYFDSKMEATIHDKVRIEKRMHAALKNREFIIHYQAKYDLRTNDLAGAEALVRWNSPEEGMLFPNSFIPIFEKNGFILQMDFYVYEEVLKTLAKWKKEGRKPIPISVNVSRVHIGTDDFLANLTKLADKYQVPYHLLELEITETVAGGKPQEILSFIEKCRNAGFPVSIDDFGSGYSSLNLLKGLPIDILKIDRGFLNESEVSHKSSIIIEQIIQMANKIDVKTLCEGVETKSQASFLKNIGCNLAQGYFYSRPVALPDFEALM